jgi:DNA (cytosine-5)-methyltransferase 1
MFIGGPPCQPFSIAANQRFRKSDKKYKRTGFNDKHRGNLLFDYIWFIKKFRPKSFLIENVQGLLSVDGGRQLERAIKILSTAGYTVSPPATLNAADYGVPQVRRRIFIIGSRTNTFLFSPSFKKRVPSISALNFPLNGAQNHITRKHNAESIMRYMKLKPKERDDAGRVNRLEPNNPSLTIIAGGMKGGGRSHLHPLIPRTLSVRESARLQTFPDDFVFYGPIARQFTQVGNAVPPLLAYNIAKAVAKQLF